MGLSEAQIQKQVLGAEAKRRQLSGMHSPEARAKAAASRTRPLADRFFEKVVRRDNSECWGWSGSRDSKGYPKMLSTGGRKAGGPCFASHVSLIIDGRPRPSSAHCALHTCDNAECTNPKHLWWGTQYDNMLDALVKGRIGNARSTLIELPFPPASLSGHNTGHWRSKSGIVSKHRKWAAMATLAAGARAPETGDIRIIIAFYPPDKRGDRINFPNRMKPYFDGIADALRVNDKRFLPAFMFGEPTHGGKVVVAIEEAPSAVVRSLDDARETLDEWGWR